jgi:hypothetical protein
MPWFKVDDGFHGHPKVMDLSLAAVGLWSLAGSWCAKYLTDGYVPSKTLPRLGGTPALAQDLHDAGLWEPAEGGWQFRDWADYQPSKAEVEAERLAARERMKKVRAAKKGVPKETDGSGEQSPNEAGTSPEVPLAPSQSLSPPDPLPNGRESPQKRATRIPDPFVLKAEMRQWAAKEVPAIDVDRATKQFVDYWRAAAGRTATKKDWLAAWRYWLRNERVPSATKLARADENAAEFYKYYGGNDERAGSVPALDPGIS